MIFGFWIVTDGVDRQQGSDGESGIDDKHFAQQLVYTDCKKQFGNAEEEGGHCDGTQQGEEQIFDMEQTLEVVFANYHTAKQKSKGRADCTDILDAVIDGGGEMPTADPKNQTNHNGNEAGIEEDVFQGFADGLLLTVLQFFRSHQRLGKGVVNDSHRDQEEGVIEGAHRAEKGLNYGDSHEGEVAQAETVTENTAHSISLIGQIKNLTDAQGQQDGSGSKDYDDGTI